MNEYDDWKMTSAMNQELAKHEYESIISKTNGLEAKSIDLKEVIIILKQLKKMTHVLVSQNYNDEKNAVIKNIEHEIEEIENLFQSIFNEPIYDVEEQKYDVFKLCNALKISIQLALEMIEKIIVSKNNIPVCDDTIAEITKKLINICKNCVSLFGECRYRYF